MKNKLIIQLKKAFTLVELIVVVTILAIIWTIWFVSYTDYLSWVRDTNRTVQLESIWDWLKLSLTRWRLPIPDDYIEVKTNWDTIAYQWYAWEEVLKKIKYDKEGKDPLDNTYFSYYATDNRKNFQLMALLEETNETVSLYNRREVLSNDIDYADRQVKVSWKKLWILTGGWDNLNVPVQEIWEIKDNWELDIATTGEEYISHIDDIDKISWSWSELIKSIYNSSCKRILESSLDNWDWIYKINPAGTEEFEVYCDMSTDWGGWTVLAKTWDETSSTKEWECSKTLSITNLNEESSDYLVHCDLWQTEFLVNQVWDGWIVWISWWNWEPNPNCAIEATKTWINNCTWSWNLETFTIKKVSDSIKPLNLACDWCWDRRIWRIWNNNSWSNNYIYDIWNGSGYWIWNRYQNTRNPTNGYTPGDNFFWYIWVR